MRHSSVKMDIPCEFINVIPLNPLISKCQIKVCYVGETANRNKSIITKETAKKMANSLPGSPIVGYYNEETEDFEEHSKQFYIEDGQLKFKKLTRPYGFVDLNARCWFQKYIDDGEDEREYLMTEGYLWTGQYPESKRVIEKGNNQSMELDDEKIDAYWTKDNNGKPEFFIINDALISGLCILGEEAEPCFQGASIESPKIEFTVALDNSFKEDMKTMINQVQEILKKGGQTELDKTKNYVKNKDDEKEKVSPQPEGNAEDKKEEEEDEKKKTSYAEEICPKCEKPISECTCEDKGNFSIEETPEYKALKDEYSALEEKYNTLINTTNQLTETINALKEFKVAAERKEKKDLINQFYMLSDVDKKDVIDNIDTYSLEDIENKLSVICFRNKVNFNTQDAEDKDPEDPTTYSLSGNLGSDSVPAWVRAIEATQGNV